VVIVVREERRISDGEALLQKLALARFRVTAALWLFDPATQEWKLVLCSPVLKRLGPIAAYAQLQRALTTLPESNITLSQIALVDSENPLIRAFRAIVTPPARNSRFVNCTFGQIHVPDAFVYFV
jgi:hypothetical protein